MPLVSLVGPLMSSGAARAPVIVGRLTANGQVGVAFNYTIRATGRPIGFTAIPLPAGLALSTAGVISGTPTAAGSTAVTITASNGVGSDSRTLDITIAAAPVQGLPVVTAGSLTRVQGTAWSHQIVATNTPLISFRIAGEPAGVTVNATGLISGTTGVPVGVHTIQMWATNNTGESVAAGTLTVTITAIPMPVVTAASLTRVEGQTWTHQIVASNLTYTPITYAISGEPAGVTVSAAGLISGTAAVAPGSYPITMTVTNAGGPGTATFNLTINVSTSWTVTNEMPGGIAGTNISQSKAAFGPMPNWTGWQPAYAADMTDDLYDALTPADQTVRLFAHFSPYTPGGEVEVPFDNFSNPNVTGNAIRQWGYDSADDHVYLDGGQNTTGNPIRMRLVKA